LVSLSEQFDRLCAAIDEIASRRSKLPRFNPYTASVSSPGGGMLGALCTFIDRILAAISLAHRQHVAWPLLTLSIASKHSLHHYQSWQSSSQLSTITSSGDGNWGLVIFVALPLAGYLQHIFHHNTLDPESWLRLQHASQQMLLIWLHCLPHLFRGGNMSYWQRFNQRASASDHAEVEHSTWNLNFDDDIIDDDEDEDDTKESKDSDDDNDSTNKPITNITGDGMLEAPFNGWWRLAGLFGAKYCDMRPATCYCCIVTTVSASISSLPSVLVTMVSDYVKADLMFCTKQKQNRHSLPAPYQSVMSLGAFPMNIFFALLDNSQSPLMM
jgi:hypothetical protein